MEVAFGCCQEELSQKCHQARVASTLVLPGKDYGLVVTVEPDPLAMPLVAPSDGCCNDGK